LGDAAVIMLVPPVSNRSETTVAGGGGQVFVLGGWHTVDGTDGAQLVSLGDGARLDVRSGRWWRIPPMPTPQPLGSPAMVWTGTEVVVVGSPCGPTPLQEDDPGCSPGGLWVLAYRPETDRWRRIGDVERAPSIEERPQAGWELEALGWTGQRAVFSLFDAPDTMLLLVDLAAANGRWVEVPQAEDRVPSTASPPDACVIGEEIVAVHGEAAASPLPALIDRPVQLWRLEGPDAGSPRWEPYGSFSRPVRDGLFSERVLCGPDALVYLPVVAPGAEASARMLWWSRGRWEELPYPPEVRTTPRVQLVMERDGVRVIWTHEARYVLSASASSWVRVPGGWPGAMELQPFADHDRLVAVEPERHREDQPNRIVLVTVDAVTAPAPIGAAPASTGPG
jgi:hypothetical protein